ncbi:MAG: REP-associated tyrosine transposase [Verrucomicrobiota bacterium]|jgi:REP element-mobilizing transposase RayT
MDERFPREPHSSDAAARRPYPRNPADAPRIPVPPRKTLPHDSPSWVDPAKEIYFITICCRKRGANLLVLPGISEPLIETIKHRHGRGDWYAHLAMVMPDHVHFLLSFPLESRLQVTISKWKEWTAKTLSIQWQRDSFEHRLRGNEGYREKADYIMANPVRAGLVATTEDWPQLFIANPQEPRR